MDKGRKFLIFLIAGAMLVVWGGYLLRADIFAPMLGIKTAED
jgi:hypothetical protein